MQRTSAPLRRGSKDASPVHRRGAIADVLHELEDYMKTGIGSPVSPRFDQRAIACLGIVAAFVVACGGGEKKAGGESAGAAPGGAGATTSAGGMPAGLPAPTPGVAPAGATLAM